MTKFSRENLSPKRGNNAEAMKTKESLKEYLHTKNVECNRNLGFQWPDVKVFLKI